MLLFMGICLFVILLLGFPMYMTLGLTVLLVVVQFTMLNPVVIMQQTIAGISTFVLIAIPMFIFAADIMTKGRTANRLVDLVKVFLGHIHGGLGISMAGACTIFGAISGSTQATVVAIGKPMRANLVESGYPGSEVNALIINSANIATLIPPSIGMIIFCVLTSTSVGELFIAGVGPGLFLFFMFSVYSYFRARRLKIPRTARASWSLRMLTTRKALVALGFPVLVIGGIYSGTFSPTEAAAMSVLYAIICEVLIYRTVRMKDLYRIALSTGAVTAAVFILIAIGQAFSWLITFVHVPQELIPIVLGQDPSAVKVLFVVTLFFFVSCMFVDPIVANLILVPIFFPVALRAGVDPIHLGIVVTLQSGIGGVTPPFGANIFTACAAFNESYLNVIRSLWPYLLMLVFFSVLIIYVPEIATFYRFFW